METGIITTWQCAYCLECPGGMTQPKYLPCGHVFCLPCLQGDFSESPELKCPTCRVVHDITDLEALPSYTACEEHEEMAMKSPHANEITNKNVCPNHPSKKLKLACRSCISVLCLECLADSKCSKGHHHELVKMDEPYKELTIDLDWCLTKLHERSSRMQELQKNVLRLMEEKKKECEQMKAAIDYIANEQIRTIKKESGKLKSDVDIYCKSCEDTIEKYLTDLSAAKDHLDSLVKNIHVKKRDNAVFEYAEATAEAEAELETDFLELRLKDMVIQRAARSTKLECSLLDRGITEMLRDLTKPVKEEVRFISAGADLTKHRISAKWASVEWTADNLLLCCTDSREIQCRDQDFNLLFSFPLEYTLAAPLGSDFLLINTQYSKCSVDLFAKTFKKTKTISLSYSYNSHDINISAYGERFSIIGGCKVHLFSKDGNLLLELSFERPTSATSLGFRFGSTNAGISTFGSGSVQTVRGSSEFRLNQGNFSSLDSDVIATRLHNDYLLIQTVISIYKLNLKEGSQPEQISRGLITPVGITIDKAGYIYTTSRNTDKICLHYSAGNTKELGHKELVAVGGLSVKGNIMAVACDKEIKLFKLF